MRRIDAINVIPFIDIMLVLLTIVLTTATFIVEGRLEILLPEAASGDTPAASERVEVAVDQEGQIFLGVDAVTLDALSVHLTGLDPATPIVLRVDAQSRFARFVAVVDLLKARGMHKLTILTRQPDS
jgi:biopolymer transport protein ExbD